MLRGPATEGRGDGYREGLFKKEERGLVVRQARRMVHDRSELRGFVRENTTVASCHGDMKPLKGGSRSGQACYVRA